MGDADVPTLKSFLPHQIPAFEYAKRRSRIALFMEMRLGKSIVTIHWAKHHGLKRILVLAPVTVLNSWWDEFDENGERCWWLQGKTVNEKVRIANFLLGGRTWYLLNYEGVRSALPMLTDVKWDAIVCDESTAIRNPSAQITKALNNLTDVRYRAILSGLPNPESPLDLFEQFRWVFGSFCGFHNYFVYRHMKFQTTYTKWDWSPKRDVLEEIKEEVHARAFVLSRKKAGVGNRKVYTRRVIEPSADVKKLLRQVDKKFEIDGTVTNHAVVKLTWLARLAGGFHPLTLEMISRHKMDELLTLVTGEFREEPVVVWFRFNEELRMAVQELQASGVRAEGMWGEVKPLDRRRLVHRFGKGVRVLCVQGKLGMYSLNLARSSTAIYYSNHYDQEVRRQSEDRIEHLLKKEDLLYVDLVTQDTPDEDVALALKEKKMDSTQLLNRLVTRWASEFRQRVFPGDLT